MSKKACPVTVGRYSYGRPDLHVWGPGNSVSIGSFTSIGGDTLALLGGDHMMGEFSTFHFFKRAKELGIGQLGGSTGGDTLAIGSDVWVGARVTFVGGLTVGHGAVVGACSVVAKDVPPYAVVVGNPARIIRYRFSERVRTRLLALAWWDWPDRRLEAEWPTIQAALVEDPA